MNTSALLQRYFAVRQAVASAAIECGRSPDSVRLLAVSKYHPVETMLALCAQGQTIFGENYLQEAQTKAKVLIENGVDAQKALHLIGHIQSRKAAKVAGQFALIHTLDSYKLAAALEKVLSEKGICQNVLIEVNIAKEKQKTGVAIEDAETFAKDVVDRCPHLTVCGLMCMPPASALGEAARPYFARLRVLRDTLACALGRPLPELSMGMSSDFACAISEGATIVRIGTNIFGARPSKLKQ